MTTTLIVAESAIRIAAWVLPALVGAGVLVWWRGRGRAEREAAFDQHVAEAVAIVDDGKVLVAEAEEFLRWIAR